MEIDRGIWDGKFQRSAGWKAFISSGLHRQGKLDYVAVILQGKGRITGTGRNTEGD